MKNIILPFLLFATTALSAAAQLGSVPLIWNAPTNATGGLDTNVVSYTIYWHTNSFASILRTNANYAANLSSLTVSKTNLATTIANLTDGTYYIAATASNIFGRVSDPSNELRADVGPSTPPGPLRLRVSVEASESLGGEFRPVTTVDVWIERPYFNMAVLRSAVARIP